MPRPVKFTLFENCTAKRGRVIELKFSEWFKRYFREHDVRGSAADTDDKGALDRAKNGPAIVLGEIPDGAGRRKESVASVHALSLDLEGFDDNQLLAVLEKLDEYT